MDTEIDIILNDLCNNESTKKEAREKLASLFFINNLEPNHKTALKSAVDAIYFNDNSDYETALYEVVAALTDDEEVDEEKINKLFKELNPE